MSRFTLSTIVGALAVLVGTGPSDAAGPAAGLQQPSGAVTLFSAAAFSEDPPAEAAVPDPVSNVCCAEPICFRQSNCCQQSYCGRPCGRAYVQVDGLVMHRTTGLDDEAIILDTSRPVGSRAVLTTDDLDFDFTGGVRALVGIPLCECKAIEFSYFGVFDSEADAVVRGDNSLAIPGDLGLASNDFYGADIVRVRYGSDLHNAEVNCVKCYCYEKTCCGYRSLEWLAGFRYLHLDEDFGITSTDFDEGTSVYAIDTENNLYGGQIGLRARGRRCRLGWELVGKAGLYGNDASQRQYVTDFPPPFLLRSPRGESDGQVAFIGELGLSLTYQLSDCLTLRGGYNLIWIEGVALAPDQLNFSFRPDSGTELCSGGGFLLHGVNAGLELCW